MLENLTRQLEASQPLSDEQVRRAVNELISEAPTPETKAQFLAALAKKGESVEEIAGFAREIRARAIELPLDDKTRASGILDVVGTGGDHLSTFNISTTVALIAASGGVMTAKHGNRAVTSQVGSADVIEALGIKPDLSPEAAAQSLRDHHFAFLFAPKYHPAFKEIVPARKLCAQRGQRTIFNFLGPLLNPARPSFQLIGVPLPQLCEPMARVLQSLGIQRGMVVCGSAPPESQTPTGGAPSRHLDELSTLGQNFLAEFYQPHALATCALDPQAFPLQPATLADLKGGDRASNAEIIRQILGGKERGPKRDIVLLNASAALLVSGKGKSLTECWGLAADLIDSGQASRKLRDLAADAKR